MKTTIATINQKGVNTIEVKNYVISEPDSGVTVAEPVKSEKASIVSTVSKSTKKSK